MATNALQKDERLPLVLAVLAHGVLFAWLAWQRPAPPPPLPERMTVTLSDDFGPVSTSPEPQADPAPDRAPVLAETPAEPEPAPLVTPEPRPVPQPLVKAPAPKPAPKAPPKQPPKQPVKKGGASDFDNAFASGTPGASGKQPAKTQPAAAPSAQLTASWSSSINAKVLRPWNACAAGGLDAEQLRVSIRFTLDRFGDVAAMEEPVVTGITEGNRPQVSRFKECAERAIRAAAPFDNLPHEFYDHWKSRKLNFRKQ